MFRQIWQKLAQLWQRVVKLFKPQTQPHRQPETLPVSDTDYEMQLMQFLDLVSETERQTAIDQKLVQLWQLAPEDGWTAWLQRFGAGVLASPQPNPELGKRLLKLGRVVTSPLGQVALKIGKQLLDQSLSQAETAQDWWQQGENALEAQEYETSLIAFENVLKLEPYHEKAWLNKGTALVNLGQLEAAIAAYDQALEIDEELALAWCYRGDALYDLGRWEDAIDSWDKALELQPDDSETLYNKGLALGRDLGRWEKAVECWNQVLELQPDDIQTLFNRGIGLGAMERWQEALASWQRVTQLEPNFRDAWINQGVAFQKLGRYGEAIEANQRAMQCEG